MFANQQISKLFTLIESIHGSAEDIDSGAMTELRAEVTRLKTLEQVLVKGTHDHKYGETSYLFLVPKCRDFSEDDFERLLVEEFEPDKDEFLSTQTIAEPTVVD